MQREYSRRSLKQLLLTFSQRYLINNTRPFPTSANLVIGRETEFMLSFSASLMNGGNLLHSASLQLHALGDQKSSNESCHYFYTVH
jgi:hypothetical protein